MNKIKKKEIVLILENIRSAENVGSIFRTADAVGVSKIYLVGYTPDPLDRFGKPQKGVAKASLGAENTIPWEHFTTITPLIKKLKKNDFEIVSLEQSPKSILYTKYNLKKCALVVGNEVTGISKKALSLSGVVIEIPMNGEKESLNVSVATGVALFQLIQ
jgi:23S rRNA (guanosine2251-2'-O)-methyltransferase